MAQESPPNHQDRGASAFSILKTFLNPPEKSQPGATQEAPKKCAKDGGCSFSSIFILFGIIPGKGAQESPLSLNHPCRRIPIFSLFCSVSTTRRPRNVTHGHPKHDQTYSGRRRLSYIFAVFEFPPKKVARESPPSWVANVGGFRLSLGIF